ncbi:UDP-glucose 4-epimerase GalE [Microbaculum sp. FT89]|uniref:UDP-glucose 4-epimerase GalE n=1 Tax=Microbaculum sp. FT89 TaxID=3447298 RepID=UPI003F539C0A
MSERRILVTGGAGYIGSHTCKVLAKHGVVPITYDNLIAGHQDAVRWGPFVPGDILDTGRVAAALAEHRPEAVIHFAAFAYVGESVEDPAKYYRNNVAGALSLLDACRATGIDNIILSSSCATYGIPRTLPIGESEPQHAINPYGRTKLMMEEIVADYAAAYGLRYVALRYFNAAGADPDGELSERHDPETHLIPRALMAASGRIPHLSVFGDDYDTDDGTCVRDYIHVTDLARAHAMATDYLAKSGASTAVNLGTGHGVSILEILRAIQRITGREVPTVMEPRRPGDPPVLVADPRLARDTLGFSADLSDIDTIVRTAAPTFGLELLS